MGIKNPVFMAKPPNAKFQDSKKHPNSFTTAWHPQTQSLTPSTLYQSALLSEVLNNLSVIWSPPKTDQTPDIVPDYDGLWNHQGLRRPVTAPESGPTLLKLCHTGKSRHLSKPASPHPRNSNLSRISRRTMSCMRNTEHTARHAATFKCSYCDECSSLPST